ncbi:hypothetical protein GOP47_0027627, partial [Adiantum capillus-veneris]
MSQLKQRLKTFEAKNMDTHTNVPATAVDPVVLSTVYQRLSAAWQDKYVGTEVLDYLLKSLDGYVEGWKNDGAYAAPWTCIIRVQ